MEDGRETRLLKMRKQKLKSSVPDADSKIKNGILHVLVKWDDKTRGSEHYVPVSSLRSTSALEGGTRVSMRHSKKLWSGVIEYSKRRRAALSLLQGEKKSHLKD